MNRTVARASRLFESKRTGGTPVPLPARRFMAPMRVQSWTSKLPMNRSSERGPLRACFKNVGGSSFSSSSSVFQGVSRTRTRTRTRTTGHTGIFKHALSPRELKELADKAVRAPFRQWSRGSMRQSLRALNPESQHWSTDLRIGSCKARVARIPAAQDLLHTKQKHAGLRQRALNSTDERFTFWRRRSVSPLHSSSPRSRWP